MPPSGDNLPRKPDPLAVLYGAGAHFVLLHDKVPVWAKWQRRRPPLDVVHAHGDRLGLMPASIGTSALDVDEGDPRELLAHHPAWAVLASRRPGGRHLYYADDRPRGNRTWAEYGCAGQLRSGRGYLVLWHDGADRLAEELRTRGRPADFRLPDLFAAAGVELPTVYPADLDRGPAIMAPARVVLPMLEVVLPGGRNPALFDTVRHWAYREDRGEGCGGGLIESGTTGASTTGGFRFLWTMTRCNGSRGTSHLGRGRAADPWIIRPKRSGGGSRASRYASGGSAYREARPGDRRGPLRAWLLQPASYRGAA